jgi:hypothetical protein
VKNLLFAFLLILFSINELFSQNTLFDDTRVSSVYIEIQPDSLNYIMKNVLSEHYFQAKFIFDYGIGSDTLQNVGFRLRGNSSRFAAKKSFKISFNEYVSGQKYQGVKKINLNGEHNDPTLIREKLYYDTWKAAGLAERRTSFVKLYINHLYYGLYTNLEEFDKEWLQKVYGEKTGNLYKCTYPADMVYLGTNQQTYKDIMSGSVTGGRAYDLQTNEDLDNYADLLALINTLNQPVDSLFAIQIAQKINIDGFLKAFALDVATGNWDDYMYNKNNYFLYHRASTNKFEFIAYDTDNTFGVDWMNVDWTIRNCLEWYMLTEPRPLASKLLSVPAFMVTYQKYLDTIVHKIVDQNVIFPHIDSLENLITSAVIDDHYRTLDFNYTTNDFFNGFIQTVDGHTPYGIKPFLIKRSNTILQQLASYSVPEMKKGYADLLVFPNPAEKQITIKTLPLDNERKGYILDMLGRQLKPIEIPMNQSENTIQIEDLKPGIYTIVLSNKDSIESKRFIKK